MFEVFIRNSAEKTNYLGQSANLHFRVSALILCSPPLMGFRGADYDKQAAVCLLEWNVMPAYAGKYVHA